MSADNVSSLLSFLDAPIMIGDPEGRVIWVNPAFERDFDASAASVQGAPLASLFDGGGREALLTAVAEVCARGETVRFRLKKGEVGYLGVASPIQAEASRVGVVILLTLEPDLDERLLAYHAEIAEPIDEARACLEVLLDETGGRRGDQHRDSVERGLSALTRAHKWSDELKGAISGQRSMRVTESVDPVKIVRQVAAQVVAHGGSEGPTLHLLVPSQLPAVEGDATMLETALLRLVRHRGAAVGLRGWLSLSARISGNGPNRGVLFSVVDHRDERDDPMIGSEEPEPRLIRATMAALGGQVVTWTDPEIGRVTSIALGLAEDR